MLKNESMEMYLETILRHTSNQRPAKSEALWIR